MYRLNITNVRKIHIGNILYDEYRAKYFKAKLSPMLEKNTFKGKTAFITGGGTGLGKAMGNILSSLGANVAICSRKIDVLTNSAIEISKASGNEVLPIQLDVRNQSEVAEAANKCIDKFGLPDIIINNAAGNFITPTELLSSNAFKTIVDIVLLGTANVTLEFGKRLIAAKQPASFLAISATYTESGSGFVVPSACAKAGVESLTKSLASEWSRYGLRFNVIKCGPIYTAGAFDRLDPTGEFTQASIKRIPTGRLGTQEELANLVSYVVSDYSTWLTGEIIKFDGGEYNMMAGEFNDLIKVSKEEWTAIANMIRKKTK